MKYPDKVTQHYSESYRNELFLLWFSNRRPSARRLINMIPEEWEGDPPSSASVYRWINEEYEDRAAVLDRQLQNEIEGRLIKEKVEMLTRHGEIGRKMQTKALAKIETIAPEDLSSSAAVRLLVEGVRIERESVGLPRALEKMLSSEDEKILDRIEQLTEESQAEILVIDADELN